LCAAQCSQNLLHYSTLSHALHLVRPPLGRPGHVRRSPDPDAPALELEKAALFIAPLVVAALVVAALFIAPLVVAPLVVAALVAAALVVGVLVRVLVLVLELRPVLARAAAAAAAALVADDAQPALLGLGDVRADQRTTVRSPGASVAMVAQHLIPMAAHQTYEHEHEHTH
jgi:hypothetical protein